MKRKESCCFIKSVVALHLKAGQTLSFTSLVVCRFSFTEFHIAPAPEETNSKQKGALCGTIALTIMCRYVIFVKKCH